MFLSVNRSVEGNVFCGGSKWGDQNFDPPTHGPGGRGRGSKHGRRSIKKAKKDSKTSLSQTIVCSRHKMQ